VTCISTAKSGGAVIRGTFPHACVIGRRCFTRIRGNSARSASKSVLNAAPGKTRRFSALLFSQQALIPLMH
jgi:hypothetical protein